MQREYISKIVLELQPRSHRGCRGLFGIRENKSFNKELFDKNLFTKSFLNEFNRRVLHQGQHVKFMGLIVAVEQIKRASSTSSKNTRIEFLLRGVSFQNEGNVSDDEEEKKGRMNDYFLNDILSNYKPEENKTTFLRHCPECKRCPPDVEVFIETENPNRPSVCLSCYNSLYTHKCGRCSKPITSDQNSIRGNGPLTIHYVTIDGSRWHLDCCRCGVCSRSLVNGECYRNGYDDQLYCYDHC